jgi:hypothetical protein
LEEEFCVGRAVGLSAERLHRSKVHAKISGVGGAGRKGMKDKGFYLARLAAGGEEKEI